MAQHDFNIANQIGSEFRADLNNALSAIATTSSGSSEPSTTFAHQLWVDTGNNLLKIRNAANNAWITIGVSITASNTFTGDITGNVTGNVTGNITGNVTGDLTGNADTATTLATARTIQLSGDVTGSTSFDGSGNVTITTTISSDSTVLGTDTTGDYVESISGGTGVTITGGAGESSTPTVAIGQAVGTTDNVTFNNVIASGDFTGDIDGAVKFDAKADGALSKGDVVCITGVSGDIPTVAKADADDAAKMPSFGLAAADANDNASVEVITFGNLTGLDTSGFSVGQILYVSTTSGTLTTTAPSGESSQIQNIGKVVRSHASAGIIKVGGAGRSNATPNLNDGKIFIGNGSNQSSTATLNTALVPESTNLYYTDARFDTRLATKDTDDLTEGTSSLYFTNERVDDRVNSLLTAGSNVTLTYDDSANTLTIAATEDDLSNNSTSDLAEGTNLYYTDARSRAAISAGGDLSYNSTTGVMSFTERTDAEVRGLVSASGDLSYNSSTGAFSFTERTDAQVRGLLSASGDLSYNSSTGAFSFTERTDAEVRGLISGSTGVTYNSSTGAISIGQAVGTTNDVTFNDVTVSGDLTVSGTTTTVNTETINLADNQIVLNSNYTGSSPTENGGIEIERGTQTNKTLVWNETDDKWTVGSEAFVAGSLDVGGGSTNGVVIEQGAISIKNGGTKSRVDFYCESNNAHYTRLEAAAHASYSGNPTVTLPTSTGTLALTSSDITGNSATATALETARTIHGVSFDGTANIDLSEEVQDTVGGMFTGNTETGITATYQDADGTIDLEIGTGNITNDMLSGSIANSKLSNSSITVSDGTNSTATALGGTITFSSGTGIDVAESSGTVTITSSDSGVTAASYGGATAIPVITVDAKGRITSASTASISTSFTLSDGSNTQSIAGGDTLTVSGTNNEVDVAVSATDTLTIGLPNDVTISNDLTVSGNLVVTGTTTQTGSVVTDNNFTGLTNSNSGNATDFGFYGKYVESSTTKYAGIFYDASTDNTFRLFTDTQTVPSTTVDTSATGYAVGNLVANLTGNVTGNASTATALETARTIGGVSFDGTANINLAGVNQTGNQDTTGNAATATALETARNFSISGDITASNVSFDGTGNVALSADIDANTVGITELNVSDGTNGQALVTDGSGNLSFSTVAVDQTLTVIGRSANVDINITSGTLVVEGRAGNVNVGV